MKQFQVPQFIDVEDRILGSITMRQFFIMLIPLGTAIALYFILTVWLMVIIAVPVAIVSAVFAFYKPNGLRFSRFIGSFLSFTFKPRLYVWKREEEATSLQEVEEKSAEKTKTSEGLKSKRGSLETGSKVSEEILKNIGNGESDYLSDIINE
ncbi:PrgI family protein [Candidatus Azambacteria bacterium]|nr:PrgI family protein [Candidatus Azambacteria bacterium]